MNPIDQWPKHPFCSLFVGRRGSGKTTLILNTLLPGGAWYKQFHQIIIVSPTAGLDPAWRKLGSEGIKFYDVFSEQIIDNIVENQTTQHLDTDIKVSDRKRVLLILDDCSNEKAHKYSKSIAKICHNGRHLSTSVLFSGQRYCDSSCAQRGNVDQVVTFAITARREVKAMFDWYGSTLTFIEFVHILDIKTERPYTYLNIRSIGGKLYYL